MDGGEILCEFLRKIGTDSRMGPVHISLYSALVKCWYEQGQQNNISITSTEVMRDSKIFSPTTYHRAIRELNIYGFLKYQRANSRWEKSKVFLFDK